VKEKDSTANIIAVDYNSPDAETLNDYHLLYNYIESGYREGPANIIAIDEVQMCPGFEKAINWLHNSEKYDIYITGSNAFLLSSNLATLFTGRTMSIEVFPFSFLEYLAYFGSNDSNEAFREYVLIGGMSGSYPYKDPKDRAAYYKEVLNTLIVRDICNKYKIRNRSLLNKLIPFLMDNIANPISVRSIADTLTSSQEKVNHKTISSYIEYLCNAFAFYKVSRFDIQGKKYLSTQEKYYLCDPAFKYALIGTKNMNYGRIYENIVAIELLRRGYEIYVGKLYRKEIDFVAIRQSEKIYIQVSDDISNEETFTREVTPLLPIKDAYPKMLIARTGHDETLYEGIIIKDISRWLSE